MIVIKLQNGSDIRRVALSDVINYSKLLELATELFGPKLNTKRIHFQYVDFDGDDISVTKDKELEEAFRIAQETNPSILKLQIVSADKKSECCIAKWWNCKKQQKCWQQWSACQQRSQCKSPCSPLKLLFIPLIVLFIFKPCLLFCLIPILLIGAAIKCFCCAKRRNSCWAAYRSSNASGCCLFNFPTEQQSESNDSQRELRPENADNADTTPVPPAKSEVGTETSSENFNTKDGTNFEVNLKRLEEMGFNDRSKSIEILIKNGGNLLRTVKDLLDKAN
jgi:hypothetical protein